MRIISLFLLICLSACFNNNSDSSISGMLKQDNNNSESITGLLKTKHGDLKIKFYPGKAPQTVKRITHLANKKFFDGIQFHRVIPNFVVQAGDPTGTGMGGSGTKIKAEFNDLKHTKGIVAMARAAHDNDSADSQFYIALNTLPHLDKKYTIFGKVIDGIEILDQIKKGDQIISFTTDTTK